MARKRAASRFVIQELIEVDVLDATVDGPLAWRDQKTRHIQDTADGLKYLTDAEKPGTFRVIAVKAEKVVTVTQKPLVVLSEPTVPAPAKAAKKGEAAAGKEEG